MATCIGFPGQRFHSTISASVTRMTGPRLIRQHEGLAPAVLADLTGHHLAVFRWLEQRAHSAAINVLWRVLIFSLLPRHFFRCFRLRNTPQKPCRDTRRNRAYDLSPRLASSFFDHGVSSPAIAKAYHRQGSPRRVEWRRPRVSPAIPLQTLGTQ